MAQRDHNSFLTGLVVGGLVGAAVALLYPRADRSAGAAGARPDQRPRGLLRRVRRAVGMRLHEAASEAQVAAQATEARLQAEYRDATDAVPASPREGI